MATIAAIVEEQKVDELTKHLIARGWGEHYSLIDKGNTGDERLFAVPAPFVSDGTTTQATGLAFEPGAAVAASGTTDEVLITNIENRMGDFDLSDEEKSYYAHHIADGGTFVVVEVDDEDIAEARELFDQVDAQQMETSH